MKIIHRFFAFYCLLPLAQFNVMASKESRLGTISNSFPAMNARNVLKLDLLDLQDVPLSKGCQQRVQSLAIGALTHDKAVIEVLAGYFDTMAKPGSGVFEGDFNWFGDYRECKGLPSSHYCTSQLTFSFKKILPSKNTSVPVNFGICSPAQCSELDVFYILDHLFKAINNTDVIKYSMESQMRNTYGKAVICDDQWELSTGNIIAITITGLLGLLCLIGTLCEMIGFSRTHKVQLPNKANGFMPVRSTVNDHDDLNVHIQSSSGYESDENKPFLSHDDVLPTVQSNRCLEFFTCFSIVKNTKAIFASEMPKGAITSLNGIRTLSMFWVILGHTYYFGMLTPMDNITGSFHITQRFSFESVANAFFSVDSFFLLSGLLVSYLSLRRLDKNERLPLVPFYLHRFLRLTPTYMFVILAYMYIYPLLGSGPSWYTQSAEYSFAFKDCRARWWTNLLYINNLYPYELGKECLGWSWYLSNDMQFYVISPLLIFAMHRYRKTGLLVTNGILLFVSFVVTGYIIGSKKLRALLISDFKSGWGTQTEDFADDIYIKPYCRIPPYLVGIVLGYMLHVDRPLIIKQKQRLVAIICWPIAITLALAVVFGPYSVFKDEGRPFTEVENILYGTFSRFAWGVALAVLIYLCSNGMGGIINSILSWRAFIPLSRLTFCAYLVHPLVIYMFYMSMERPFHYSDVSIVYIFFSFLTMAYSAAYVLALLVEFPFMNLQKLVFKF